MDFEFSDQERTRLAPYFTNLDRPVFALRALPEVVKGALFSRYSRTEKSLRRVFLDEFLTAPEAGLDSGAPAGAGRPVATERAEAFYQRVLVGYGDDSVAELAGAHVAVEDVSMLAAKALEDSRIGISPLEKSTRYVRFDRPGPDGRFRYLRAAELAAAGYEPAMDRLFTTYSELIEPLTADLRRRYPIQAGETERAWKAATRARALDLLRGLLPASALTNLGLYGNGRALEYLITKLAADLPECRRLAAALHVELTQIIPAFVRRALDPRHGQPAARRLAELRERLVALAEPGAPEIEQPPGARLVAHEPGAAERIARAALFGAGNQAWDQIELTPERISAVLDAVLGGREHRRQRPPRALEHALYTFELVGNFGAFRDLQRHRMLTQERQPLGTGLGYDTPAELVELGYQDRFTAAVEAAAEAHARLLPQLGPALAQYLVPIAFRVRWYVRANLREIIHLCELRTTPQGHPDYRSLAQEMWRRVAEVDPELTSRAGFVDLDPGEELERRESERRIDARLNGLEKAAARDSEPGLAPGVTKSAG